MNPFTMIILTILLKRIFKLLHRRMRMFFILDLLIL